MNVSVSNEIAPGATTYGTVIQAGNIGGMRLPQVNTTRMAAHLSKKLNEEGPLLAVMTKGQTEAAIRLLSLVADEHPELAEIADRLAEDAQERLDAHK